MERTRVKVLRWNRHAGAGARGPSRERILGEAVSEHEHDECADHGAHDLLGAEARMAWPLSGSQGGGR